MGRKTKNPKLICGFPIESEHTYKGTEFLKISIHDLYEGYGEGNDLRRLATLFTELADLGYEPRGLEREIGYYDSIDDLYLTLHRPIPKGGKNDTSAN